MSSSWYIHGLTRELRNFIQHCPECLILQTRRHAPYGNLQPIPAVPVPFHTLTIDFILALPVAVDGVDCMMSATCKFSKGVQLIPGKSTWTAKDWGRALLNRLDLVGWGLPKATITDRDRKFMSEMWKSIFEQLKVSLLYSTGYHPQTDGASERTNQTAEIAMRYFIHTLDRPNLWPEIVPRMQGYLNSSGSPCANEVIYGFTPNRPLDLIMQGYLNSSGSPCANEVIYGFTPNRPLDLIAKDKRIDHVTGRISVKEAIDSAQMSDKFHYDRKHQPMFLKVGDWALLRLHKGYKIPSTAGVTKKLTQQYVGPFEVIERVGRLAYRLEIPEGWLIHPVFSIAHLEPCPAPGSDPFERSSPDHIPPVSTHPDGSMDCEIERLLNKRTYKKGRGYVTEYLLRWKSYGPEWDRWYDVKDLEGAGELIKEYEEEMAPFNTAKTSSTPKSLPKRGRGRPKGSKI